MTRTTIMIALGLYVAGVGVYSALAFGSAFGLLLIAAGTIGIAGAALDHLA